MRFLSRAFLPMTLLGLLTAPIPALADDDIEGVITSLDAGGRTLVVNGITIHADDRTDYDDDLNSFADLKVGDRVEVDFVDRDGRKVAREIERDD